MNTDLIDLKLKNLNERYSTEPEKFELWAITLNSFWYVKHKGKGKPFKKTKTKGIQVLGILDIQTFIKLRLGQKLNQINSSTKNTKYEIKKKI